MNPLVAAFLINLGIEVCRFNDQLARALLRGLGMDEHGGC